jgi:hypothetical protein
MTSADNIKIRIASIRKESNVPKPPSETLQTEFETKWKH